MTQRFLGVVVASLICLMGSSAYAADQDGDGKAIGQALSDMKTIYGTDGVIDDIAKHDGQNLDKVTAPREKPATDTKEKSWWQFWK
ncbi:MAG: hypothetical protein KDI89_06665 [Gammaproteobacteria bacterium]|nr:hypothetical protein [Gammaproteobacteria bacterium]